VCEVLATGEMYSSDVMKQAAVSFIRRNGSAVMRTVVWRHFVRDQPRLMDYVVARLAGVPPPQPGDYEVEEEEDESKKNEVEIVLTVKDTINQ
jgi:hypothetical protein